MRPCLPLESKFGHTVFTPKAVRKWWNALSAITRSMRQSELPLAARAEAMMPETDQTAGTVERLCTRMD